MLNSPLAVPRSQRARIRLLKLERDRHRADGPGDSAQSTMQSIFRFPFANHRDESGFGFNTDIAQLLGQVECESLNPNRRRNQSHDAFSTGGEERPRFGRSPHNARTRTVRKTVRVRVDLFREGAGACFLAPVFGRVALGCVPDPRSPPKSFASSTCRRRGAFRRPFRPCPCLYPWAGRRSCIRS